MADAPERFKYYPKPWRFTWGKDAMNPAVVDAKGGSICSLYWAAHPVEETEEADCQTRELGEAIAALGNNE